MRKGLLSLSVFWLAAVSQAQQPSSFVNFETAPVHPVAISPDGRTLAVCNLPDGRVELLGLADALPTPLGDVPVGIDPVSLRFRSTNELWVLNHISRSINVVDVARRLVVDSLATLDGPADIQFAGSPLRAFVSCAKENTVQVFDATTRQVITNLVIAGERPKAMALSPDGTKLYVAIFESGNGSTILVGTQPDTDKILKHPSGPYGGQFPVPNCGTNFCPPRYMSPDLSFYESMLPDSLIVKRNAAGQWMDDNHGDWTEFISGTNAGLSGRVPGWDLPDRDMAIVDTTTLGVTYVSGLMNICMDVAVNPVSGRIAVIGTDGTNERRFEPNLRGTFVRVELALIDPLTWTRTILDLNPHLDYSSSSVPQNVRDRSLGDPRGLVWNSAGTRAYVTGMGSRNLVVLDANGQRVGSAPIELGEGPSGLALDESRQRLYVLNRFSATLSVLDTTTLNVVTNVAFFDPTPAAIKVGRKHLYDTRRNSGLGQVSCGSCHVDARFDRLAWDLGDPRGDITYHPGSGDPFHPMKGPLVTQTLQDVINPTEPGDFEDALHLLHWRGDRIGIESFNITFTDLLARDTLLTTNEMQEFKDFLSTIYFPPSRFRNLDNSLPTDLPLRGFFGVDSNGVPDQTPLPDGDAARGFERFFNDPLNGRFFLLEGATRCVTCHHRQSGGGIEGDFELFGREGNRPFRAVPLRTIADKLGMDLQRTNSRAGFGFRFDGREDTLTSLFVDVFRMTDNQAIADLTAFLLAFPGRKVPPEDFGSLFPDDSLDSHAAVGTQFTVRGPQGHPLLAQILELASYEAQSGLEIVVRGLKDGLNRSWYFVGGTGQRPDVDPPRFQSDRNNEQLTLNALLALASPDAPLTFTVLPPGTGRRIAVDRDEDGYFDRTEIENGFDPNDPLSHPDNLPPQIEILSGSGFLHPGMPLQIVFGATDSDSPAQTLTFSLDSAPDGAGIDPTNGVLSWTPTLEQGDHEYRIWVRVTDDGVPPLSAVMPVDVRVSILRVLEFHPDRMGGINEIRAGSNLGFLLTGRSYRLQYKDRLETPVWTDVGDPVVSNGSILLRDPTAANATQRFYRVVLIQ